MVRPMPVVSLPTTQLSNGHVLSSFVMATVYVPPTSAVNPSSLLQPPSPTPNKKNAAAARGKPNMPSTLAITVPAVGSNPPHLGRCWLTSHASPQLLWGLSVETQIHAGPQAAQAGSRAL